MSDDGVLKAHAEAQRRRGCFLASLREAIGVYHHSSVARKPSWFFVSFVDHAVLSVSASLRETKSAFICVHLWTKEGYVK